MRLIKERALAFYGPLAQNKPSKLDGLFHFICSTLSAIRKISSSATVPAV